MKYMKGQSAMEYLMTYGWALLVIVIVIAVLMFIRPFGAPESCIFKSPGFTCEGHRIFGDTSAYKDTIRATVKNAQQQAIKDVDAVCMRGSASPPAAVAWTTLSTTTVPHGESIGLLENGAHCYNEDGTTATIFTGEDFAGTLYLRFRFRDEPSTIPQKIAVAGVIGRAQ
ncbi:MAG: hypothetical protein V1822_04215 [Candidatus Micrarchaeota archaeon]